MLHTTRAAWKTSSKSSKRIWGNSDHSGNLHGVIPITQAIWWGNSDHLECDRTMFLVARSPSFTHKCDRITRVKVRYRSPRLLSCEITARWSQMTDCARTFARRWGEGRCRYRTRCAGERIEKGLVACKRSGDRNQHRLNLLRMRMQFVSEVQNKEG